jgi:outer membrane murein-binding lipoprotein Lpp
VAAWVALVIAGAGLLLNLSVLLWAGGRKFQQVADQGSTTERKVDGINTHLAELNGTVARILRDGCPAGRALHEMAAQQHEDANRAHEDATRTP